MSAMTVATLAVADYIGDVFQASAEGGDGYTDSVGKIASEAGMTEAAVKDAIHRVKAGMGRNTGQRNPDVVVNPKTGDVRPKGPKGKPSDSIGNIFD